jgi:hypothetical protein
MRFIEVGVFQFNQHRCWQHELRESTSPLRRWKHIMHLVLAVSQALTGWQHELRESTSPLRRSKHIMHFVLVVSQAWWCACWQLTIITYGPFLHWDRHSCFEPFLHWDRCPWEPFLPLDRRSLSGDDRSPTYGALQLHVKQTHFEELARKCFRDKADSRTIVTIISVLIWDMEIYESTGLLLQRTVTSRTSSSLELYFWTEVLAVSRQLPACLGTVRLLADAK